MTGVAPSVSPLSVSTLAQITLSLVAIVALIYAVSWILKRFRLGLPRGRSEIAVIDQLALGPRERIVLLRVGASQVLIGIGTGGLVSLTPLGAPLVLAGPAPAPLFADRLREFMKRPGATE